jgi:hypothetical protein
VLGVRGCVHGRLQSGLRDACSFNLDTMGMSSPTHRRQPEGYRLPVGAMHQEPSGCDEAIRRHSTRRSPACNQHSTPKVTDSDRGDDGAEPGK